MKTIQLNLYPVSELEGEAKQKAVENYRYINVEYFDWWDYIYDEFVGICRGLGLTVKYKEIYFRGFYSQGDGSMFTGYFDLTRIFKAVSGGNWKGDYEHASIEIPTCHIDRRVIRLIEEELLDISAIVTHPSRAYYVTAEISAEIALNTVRYPLIVAELDKLEKWLKSIAQILNSYLFKTLQNAYEADTADEAVINAIEANEYWFTADGEKANRLEGLTFNQSLKAMP